MAEITAQQVEAGQAVYSKFVLAIYDLWVLQISNSFIWKCPSSRLLKLYNQHISANHLDIGVGSGFFLDSCVFPTNKPRLALIDLNPNSLEVTSRRVARYHPEIYRSNVLEAIEIDCPKFDSVGLNYLLHCLPGNLETKSVVFQNIKPLLNPSGIVFGSTLLGKGIKSNSFAKYLMNLYNSKEIFSNQNDSLEDLKTILQQNFSEFAVEVVGCAAIFWGRNY